MSAPASGIQASIAASIPNILLSIGEQQSFTIPMVNSGQLYTPASIQECAYRTDVVNGLATYSKTGQGAFAGITIVSATIDPLNAAVATAQAALAAATPSDDPTYYPGLVAAVTTALEAVVAYYTTVITAI